MHFDQDPKVKCGILGEGCELGEVKPKLRTTGKAYAVLNWFGSKGGANVGLA